MRKILLLLVCSFLLKFSLFGQPANNDCSTALVIPELSNWCSSTQAFANQGATSSNFMDENCFSNDSKDVWFTFVAGALEVSITVIGDSRTDRGGSLRNPEVELLTGECGGSFRIIRCEIDEDNNHVVQLRRGGLVVGETYFVRIAGANGDEGTFQICVNNYNPPANAGSDAPTAGVLCDKSSFTFEKLSGAGQDRDEADNTCLDRLPDGRDGGDSESSSTWFTWTAETSGPLTFTLIPLQASDDIDFALYELPNGINDFTDKQLLRCMATACPGPTGLSLTSTDTEEDINCDAGEDGFVRFIDMIEGVSYALLINNFSDSGNGITIEFGQEPGSGTFLGPAADFVSDEPDNQVCVGEDVSFDDISTFPNGQITNWQWSFGVGATPETIAGPGPHEVVYSSSGVKSVVLSVETDLGCILTKISNFTVLEEAVVEPLITAPDCGGATDGAVVLNVSGGATPYTFSWNGSAFAEGDDARRNVGEGDFIVQVRDGEGCTQIDTILLREPGPALDSDVDQIVPPSCSEFSDGRLVIRATEGTPPYQFDFGNGLTASNTLENIPAGQYAVYVVDSRGCDSDFLLTVEDPEVLELTVDAIDISCNGEMDGNAMASAIGGHGEYQYLWSTGTVGDLIQGLNAGTFDVTVTDKFGCEVFMPFTITEPDAIDILEVNPRDALCFGEPNGQLEIVGSGGVPPYEYAVNGGTFQSDPTFQNLFAGTYTITLRDREGCVTQFENVTINQPSEIAVEAGENQTVNLGETTLLSAMTNVNPVTYFWSGPDTIQDPNNAVVEVLPRNATYYTVMIQDEMGCTALDSLLVNVVINRPVYIPNAFSPNGDGVNQRFTIYGGAAVSQIQLLQVYSRWGELLYEVESFLPGLEEVGWDGTFNGKVMNPGVYVFRTKVEFLDGVVETYTGDFALVR